MVGVRGYGRVSPEVVERGRAVFFFRKVLRFFLLMKRESYLMPVDYYIKHIKNSGLHIRT